MSTAPVRPVRRIRDMASSARAVPAFVHVQRYFLYKRCTKRCKGAKRRVQRSSSRPPAFAFNGCTGDVHTYVQKYDRGAGMPTMYKGSKKGNTMTMYQACRRSATKMQKDITSFNEDRCTRFPKMMLYRRCTATCRVLGAHDRRLYAALVGAQQTMMMYQQQKQRKMPLVIGHRRAWRLFDK